MAFSGATREMCKAALEAAHGDPNLAFEYLQTGIPRARPVPAGGQATGGLPAFVYSPEF